jgi:hypothetical protein
MKTMTDPISAEQLQEVLRLHRIWLNGDTSGVRANITGANLTRANLADANLAGDLTGATGNMREVKSAHIERWPVVWTQSPDGVTTVQIGCQRHRLEWWASADEDRITAIDTGGWEAWKRLGPIVLSLIKASPATP